MIHLALEEKLAIASACAAVIALLAAVMACKLSPACFFYKFCPFKATYDDEEDEEMAAKVSLPACPPSPDYKKRYKLIDHKNLLTAVPSIKVTSLDETIGHPTHPNLRQTKSLCISRSVDYAATGRAPVGAYLQTRPAKRSTSSISGSSTASSENVTPPRGRFLPRFRKSSGTFSSDGDDTVSAFTPSVLEIGLQYDEKGEKLIIFLYRARRIPPNVYGGANDTYVRVIVGRDTDKYWRRRSEVPVQDLLRRKAISPPPTTRMTASRSLSLALGDNKMTPNDGYTKMAEFQTRLIRKDAEPIFKEGFTVDDVKLKEKKNVWIKFILHSIDRFSHEYIVGSRQVGLDRASPMQSDMEHEKFIISLDRYTPNLGDITLSLCYMPTAARLVVTINKIANLKPPDGLAAANPYVKGAILRRGKVLEKHVTSAQVNAVNPSFVDEPLVFDVPASELEKIVLLITVIHDESLSDTDSLSASGIPSPRRRSFGDCLDVAPAVENAMPLHKSHSNSCVSSKGITSLGRLAFGSLAAVESTSKRHWMEMMSNQRKHIVQTHKLRP